MAIKIKKNILIFLLSVFFTGLSIAQTGFFQANSTFRANVSHRSFSSGGTFDLNGDKLTDILIMHQGRTLIVGYNRGPGIPMLWDTVATHNDVMFSITVGDLDNDGTPEIIVGGLLTGIFSYKREASGKYSLFQNLNPQRNIFVQASNLIDVNGDGYLDLFVCNDIGTNRLYVNDQSGRLIDQTLIDFATIPSSDNSGNYGSDWADINNDGLPDLYIAKCRAGVNNPTDPRRVNMLFVSGENGTYQNRAQDLGVASGEQSWTATFADLDNDGDFDIIVTNHYAPHIIYINDGAGNFSTFNTNINNFAFQCIVADFDNNGFLDFYIPGADTDIMVWNHGDLNFEAINRPLDSVVPFSAYCGDFNNDGFEDLVASYARGLDLPGNVPDMMWLNSGNDNHWVRFHLEGKESNRSGIGAVLKLYGLWGVMMRSLKGGESYGITNSNYVHFGMANWTTIDSLEIRWPSGITQKFYDLDFNTHYHITEGICLTDFISLSHDVKDYYCDGELISISAVNEFQHYHWSTGSLDSQTLFTVPGLVSLQAEDDTGCKYQSKPAIFTTNSAELKVLAQNLALICNNSPLELLARIGFQSYVWSNGSNDQTIQVTTPGTYRITVTDSCGDQFTDQVSVTRMFSVIDQVQHATVQQGMNATLSVNAQGRVDWFYEAEDEIPFHTGRNLIVNNVQKSDTFFVQNTNSIFSNHTVGLGIGAANMQLPPQNINSGLVVLCEKDLTLRDFVVRLPAGDSHFGPRRFLLQTFDGQTLQSVTVDIRTSLPFVVSVDWELKAGVRYLITTDGAFNLDRRGVVAPGLLRTNTNVAYPYSVNDALTIERSMHGTSVYYYFYDIRISVIEDKCESARQQVFLTMNPLNVDELSDDYNKDWRVIPNPVYHSFYLENEQYVGRVDLEIFDQMGRSMLALHSFDTNNAINVSRLSAGIYTMMIRAGHRQIEKLRIVKLDN